MKHAFSPDDTPKKRAYGVSADRWNLPFVVADDDIAVTSVALAGPDIWFDGGLMRAIFLSYPLVQALDGAGVRAPLRLKKCRIV